MLQTGKLIVLGAQDVSDPKITICKRCKYFINIDPFSCRRDVWYNHLCRASPLPKKVDPYDGKMKSYRLDRLNRVCFTQHDFEYCRDVNDGSCLKFQKKSLF